MPNKDKRRVFRRIKNNLAAYAVISPFLILFTVYTVFPVVLSLPLAFFNIGTENSMPYFVGFDNFGRLFSEDSQFIKSAINSVVLTFMAAPVCFILCFFTAWFIFQMPAFFKRFFSFVFFIPALAGGIYTAWQAVFSGGAFGYLNSRLFILGITDKFRDWQSDPVWALLAVVTLQLWLSFGVGFLALTAGFKTVPGILYEAAATEGMSNRFQELLYITLPAVTPHLAFAAAVQLAGVMAQSEIISAMTEGSVSTLSELAYLYAVIKNDPGYASAVCFVIFAAVIGVYICVRRILATFISHGDEGGLSC